MVEGGHVSVLAGANAVKRMWPHIDRWLGKRRHDRQYSRLSPHLRSRCRPDNASLHVRHGRGDSHSPAPCRRPTCSSCAATSPTRRWSPPGCATSTTAPSSRSSPYARNRSSAAPRIINRRPVVVAPCRRTARAGLARSRHRPRPGADPGSLRAGARQRPGAADGADLAPDQQGALSMFSSLGFRPEALLRDHVKDRDGVTHDIVIVAHSVRRRIRRQPRRAGAGSGVLNDPPLWQSGEDRRRR